MHSFSLSELQMGFGALSFAIAVQQIESKSVFSCSQKNKLSK